MMWLAAGVILVTFAVGWCVGWWCGFCNAIDAALDLDSDGLLRAAAEVLDEEEP